MLTWMQVDCRAHALPFEAHMVPGRTLLWEAAPGLSAHDSQFSFKLRQDRDDFPSPIHNISWSPYTQMTGHNIDMLRASFGDVGFNVPPIYAPGDAQVAAGLTCFEELLVPRNEQFMYRSAKEAESFHAAVGAMCRLDPDSEASMADRASRPHILFLERPFDRQIINAPSMCTWVKHKLEAEAQLISDSLTDRHGVCAAIDVIRKHDIFVTIGGSQALLLAFARLGSVVILVDPKNTFDGLTKLQLSTAGMHVLEFTVHRPTELVADLQSFARVYPKEALDGLLKGPLNGPDAEDHHPLLCARVRTCIEFWRRHHLWLNVEELVAFVEDARNVSNSVSVGADGSELDSQFREWGIDLDDEHESPFPPSGSRLRSPPCQRRPAEPDKYPFSSKFYGRYMRRVAWEVSRRIHSLAPAGCLWLSLAVRIFDFFSSPRCVV
jgi:hypothetical protein